MITVGPARPIFPAQTGVYVLILSLAALARIEVGRLGVFDFAAGWYAYAGSACGSGGLRGRLAHHLYPIARPHWHIDSLRREAVVDQVWYAPGASRHEHLWAAALAGMTAARIPVQGFGSSDCRCPSHLIHAPQGFDFADFCARVCQSPSEETMQVRTIFVQTCFDDAPGSATVIRQPDE